MQLSNSAWATLSQLKAGGVFDGDLVSKHGRTELIEAGLAKRDRKFESGPYVGCQINELTEAGKDLAARMSADDWHGSGRRS